MVPQTTNTSLLNEHIVKQERLGWDPLQRYISDSNITQKKIKF